MPPLGDVSFPLYFNRNIILVTTLTTRLLVTNFLVLQRVE